VGDDIEVYADPSRTSLLTVFHTLRQQMEKAPGHYNWALADLIAPKQTGLEDYLGAFAVTAGGNIDALLERFRQENDDYNSIMAKALADRLAEALAELMHKRAREFWGYGKDENLAPEDLIHERYRGIRPAPGYPACPDHSEKRDLFDLLHVEKNAGIDLTENFAMSPAASVCGFYFSHPEAKYFAVGKIGPRSGGRLPSPQRHGPASSGTLAAPRTELRPRPSGVHARTRRRAGSLTHSARAVTPRVVGAPLLGALDWAGTRPAPSARDSIPQFKGIHGDTPTLPGSAAMYAEGTASCPPARQTVWT